MRLWSLHPRYLDRQGLTACWREALLAQAVIAEPGRGYSRHPQLLRFQQSERPRAAIGDYLDAVADEADARGYHFNRGKIQATGSRELLTVSDGQLAYEWQHLLAKLQQRSPSVAARWQSVLLPDPHPLFSVVDGPVAAWEKVGSPPAATPWGPPNMTSAG